DAKYEAVIRLRHDLEDERGELNLAGPAADEAAAGTGARKCDRLVSGTMVSLRRASRRQRPAVRRKLVVLSRERISVHDVRGCPLVVSRLLPRHRCTIRIRVALAVDPELVGLLPGIGELKLVARSGYHHIDRAQITFRREELPRTKVRRIGGVYD